MRTCFPILQESIYMMKKAGYILCIAAFLALLGARPASAQLRFGFKVPLDVDPNLVLTLIDSNPLFSNGAVLVPPTPVGTIGVELHAKVPGPLGGYRDVTQVEITFALPSSIPLILDSQGFGTYAPWTVMD